MKVGVIKLGARISFNNKDTSGGNGEARSIIKMLAEGGAEVHAYTKILKKDVLPEHVIWHNIEDEFENLSFDVLLVINGSVNFFGGAEDRAQILNYHIINKFKGPVFYAYCDPALLLKQIWPAMESKSWSTSYNKEDIEITRSDIVYISQPHDVARIGALIGGKSGVVVPSKIIHFPFEQFPCLNEQLPVNPSPIVDLSYGGTMRGGKRVIKMIKYYFGYDSDISVEMFGKIARDEFDDKFLTGIETFPKFTGTVNYDAMLPKMNEAMCHIVIGDPLYERINDMAQRAYESIWSNVITFIDSDMDQLRRVYGKNKELSDFLYLSSKSEAQDKIRMIKHNPRVRMDVLADQLATIKFNPTKYCEEFVDCLTENL